MRAAALVPGVISAAPDVTSAGLRADVDLSGLSGGLSVEVVTTGQVDFGVVFASAGVLYRATFTSAGVTYQATCTISV